MPIQSKIIGRVPLWFEYTPGREFKSMNRTTYMGSEFQVKLAADGSLNRTTTQVPGTYNEETQTMTPNSDWILISDLSAAWHAGEKIKRYWGETENPEFVEVHTDNEDKVLYGVQADGNFYFGGGVPQQVKDFVSAAVPGVNPEIQGNVYYGTNPNATDNPSRPASNSISGVYQIYIPAGSRIYFFVPAAVTNLYATVNGMEIPFVESSVTIGGQSYKKYESANTYDEATLNIVLA